MRKIVITLVLTLLCTSAWALRINRPPTLSDPIDAEQIRHLQKYVDDLWNLQNGEFNFDIVTTTKTNAANGSIWILQTGVTSQIQWKANDTIYTISP